MSGADKEITEEQKKAAAFLTRPRLRFEPKLPEHLAAEAKAAAEGQARLDAETYANAQPGDSMPDGTICAGISPATGKQIFAMPMDAGVIMPFNKAAEYVKRLNAEKIYGHDDWRLPTMAELRVLFQNKEKGALKGTFNSAAAPSANWFWSSTPAEKDLHAYGLWLPDSFPASMFKGNSSSVRCVR